MRSTEKMRLRIIAIIAMISLALTALFVAFGRFDIVVAELYFLRPQAFVLSRRPVALFVNDAMQWLTLATIVVLVAGLAWSWWRGRTVLSLGPRQFGYVLLCFVIAPGLIANALLKENWGRARPMYVKEFGGTLEYTPPFVIGNQCKRNCSFVSGDVTSAFTFLAFAPIATRRRRLYGAAALGFGVVIGLNRLLQGAHFLSDVVFAGLIAVLTVLILREVLLEDGCFARPVNALLRRWGPA